MTKLKMLMPTAEHQALRDELYAVLHKHQDMKTIEMIGVTAQLIGHVLAVTGSDADQYKLLDMIAWNVINGREAALLQLSDAQGNA